MGKRSPMKRSSCKMELFLKATRGDSHFLQCYAAKFVRTRVLMSTGQGHGWLALFQSSAMSQDVNAASWEASHFCLACAVTWITVFMLDFSGLNMTVSDTDSCSYLESIATAIACQLESQEGRRFSKSTEAPVKTRQKETAKKEQTLGKR